MEILLPAERIQQRVDELARQIAADFHGRPTTIVGVLTGCLMFLSDLVRRIDLPLRIGLVQASSYRGADHHARRPARRPRTHARRARPPRPVARRHPRHRPDAGVPDRPPHRARRRSVRSAVLLRKIGRQRVPVEPDYCGFDIPDVFVVGYGLDYNDEYRHLPYIGIVRSP